MHIVFDYADDILEYFEIQSGVPKIHNSNTITLATGFVNCLQNSTFFL